MIDEARKLEFSELLKEHLEDLVSFIVSHDKPEDYARRILLIYRMKEAEIPIHKIAQAQAVGPERAFNLYRKACFYLDKYSNQALAC